ncbi:MAG: molybdenum cofactor biosynthesis protein MoaE, partial [Planctomycetota bacterium]
FAELDAAARCGADLRFDGVVRRAEGDAAAARDLHALDYEVYEPMASRLLLGLAESIAREHGLASIVALHSRGAVPVGATSFVLRVRSPHRAEAIVAVTAFIDRLKRDVPIWKRPVWASGEQQLR